MRVIRIDNLSEIEVDEFCVSFVCDGDETFLFWPRKNIIMTQIVHIHDDVDDLQITAMGDVLICARGPATGDRSISVIHSQLLSGLEKLSRSLPPASRWSPDNDTYK